MVDGRTNTIRTQVSSREERDLETPRNRHRERLSYVVTCLLHNRGIRTE